MKTSRTEQLLNVEKMCFQLLFAKVKDTNFQSQDENLFGKQDVIIKQLNCVPSVLPASS